MTLGWEKKSPGDIMIVWPWCYGGCVAVLLPYVVRSMVRLSVAVP